MELLALKSDGIFEAEIFILFHPDSLSASSMLLLHG